MNGSTPAAGPQTRAVQLEIRNASGNCTDRSHDKHFADGKPITREAYETIKRSAVRLEPETSWQSGGAWTFFRWAHVPVAAA